MYSSTPSEPDLRGKVVLFGSTGLWRLRPTKSCLQPLDDERWGVVCPGKYLSNPLYQSLIFYLVRSSTRWNTPRNNPFLRQNEHLSSNRRPGCSPSPPNSRKPLHGRPDEINIPCPSPHRTTPLSQIPRPQESTPWSNGKSLDPSLPRPDLPTVEGGLQKRHIYVGFSWPHPLLLHSNHRLHR